VKRNKTTSREEINYKKLNKGNFSKGDIENIRNICEKYRAQSYDYKFEET